MIRLKRSERVAALLKILSDNPNQIFTLNYFSELFGAAKSTISEDVGAAKGVVEQMNLGLIETLPGASGGVKYKPLTTNEKSIEFLKKLCEELNDYTRLIPGKFLYMADVICNPTLAVRVGEIFATKFMDKKANYVVTIETKGITLALMTARALNIPLVIVRRDSKVTEGSTISINYVSGSSHRIQTMSISKRSLSEGSRVLIIDDFMKAGGTAKGLLDLMAEFNSEVVGIGVLISTDEPEHKMVDDYYSLLKLKQVDEVSKKIIIIPSI